MQISKNEIKGIVDELLTVFIYIILTYVITFLIMR
jgi:hypothetical protein